MTNQSINGIKTIGKQVALTRTLQHLKTIEVILLTSSRLDKLNLIQTTRELIDDVEREVRLLPPYLLSV